MRKGRRDRPDSPPAPRPRSRRRAAPPRSASGGERRWRRHGCACSTASASRARGRPRLRSSSPGVRAPAGPWRVRGRRSPRRRGRPCGAWPFRLPTWTRADRLLRPDPVTAASVPAAHSRRGRGTSSGSSRGVRASARDAKSSSSRCGCRPRSSAAGRTPRNRGSRKSRDNGRATLRSPRAGPARAPR